MPPLMRWARLRPALGAAGSTRHNTENAQVDEDSFYLTPRLVRLFAPDLTMAEAEDFTQLIMKAAARNSFARAQWMRHRLHEFYASKKLRGYYVPRKKRHLQSQALVSLRSGRVFLQPHGKARGAITADTFGDGELRIANFCAYPVRDGRLEPCTPMLLSSIVDLLEAQGTLANLTYR